MPEVKPKNPLKLHKKVSLSTFVEKKVRVRFCAAAVDTRFLAVIGGEMDGEVRLTIVAKLSKKRL